MSFLRISFFKTAKPRKFEPIPRFYEPNKEAFDKLLQKRDDETKAKVERIKYKVRNKFQSLDMGDDRIAGTYRRGARSSNLRLIVILLLMLILIYIIFIY